MANQILLDQLAVDSQGYGARLGVTSQNAIDAANRNYETQKAIIGGGAQAGGGLLDAYAKSEDKKREDANGKGY